MAIWQRTVLISVEIIEKENTEIIRLGIIEEAMEVASSRAGVGEEIRIFDRAGEGGTTSLEAEEGDLRMPRLSNSPFPHHQYKELLSDCHHNY